MIRYVEVDPRALRVSSQRMSGADPWKLQRQIALFGKSIVGMPMIEVEEDADGLLGILDGMTRATRVAKFLPGTRLTVAITGPAMKSLAKRPTIADVLP